MSDKQQVVYNTTRRGIGPCTALFLIFLVLKLTGIITWSWWWVTAPLWIPLLVVLGIVALVFLGIGGAALIAAILDK